MSSLESDAMEAEFDTVAGWTEEAVRALGPEHAIPAGCRGSGSEGALRWLADRLELHPGARMLDEGAGGGGPAGRPAWGGAGRRGPGRRAGGGRGGPAGLRRADGRRGGRGAPAVRPARGRGRGAGA